MTIDNPLNTDQTPPNGIKKNDEKSKLHLLNFWVPTLISIAAILVSLFSGVILSIFVSPRVEYSMYQKERNAELIVSYYLIKNNGNKAAEDIDFAISIPRSSTFGVTDSRTYDTVQYHKDEILTVYFSRKYLIPSDSILISIESDTATINKFNRIFDSQKGESGRVRIPSLLYFKSKDGYAKKK